MEAELRFVYLSAIFAAVVAAISPPADAKSQREARIHKQLTRYHHADGVIKSIGKVAYRTIYSSNPRKRHKWKGAVRWLMRVRADALAKIQALRAPPWPPHHALWLCIHAGEGAWDDPNSGGNGHYGGLQMTPGWGEIPYGHTADEYSQYQQEWFAEHGYRDSGYSSGWLQGQWGQTIGPCWELT